MKENKMPPETIASKRTLAAHNSNESTNRRRGQYLYLNLMQNLQIYTESFLLFFFSSFTLSLVYVFKFYLCKVFCLYALSHSHQVVLGTFQAFIFHAHILHFIVVLPLNTHTKIAKSEIKLLYYFACVLYEF